MAFTLFSNQQAIFRHPADEQNVTYEVRAFEFTSGVPDWVKDSWMFKALSKDGKIKVIENKQDIVAIENKGKIQSADLAKAVANVEDEEEIVADKTADDMLAELTLADVKDFKAKKLYDVCVAKGLDVEEKQNKNYYLEVLASAETAE